MLEKPSLIMRIEDTIRTHDLASSDSVVLLMVSGGSDSTALAYLASELHEKKLIGELGMLHVNHNIRGEDADTDQRFVEQLAEALEIPLFTCEIDVPAEVRRTGENEEAVARRERYLAANEALDSLCRHMTMPLADGCIFTAHTQDDRVENFYMRSIVGTGPGGFRSMLYANGPVVRPLLDVGRDELRSYIEQREKNGLATACDAQGNLWREDATNAHTDKFRAYVRHEIVTRAKERNSQLLETLTRTMNLIADEDDMIEEMVDELESESVIWLETAQGLDPDYRGGCLLSPVLARSPKPMQRRLGMRVLQKILGPDARVETASIDRVLDGFDGEAMRSGYTHNIQGDLAVSANKKGVRIEPMGAYRARRKRTEGRSR